MKLIIGILLIGVAKIFAFDNCHTDDMTGAFLTQTAEVKKVIVRPDKFMVHVNSKACGDYYMWSNECNAYLSTLLTAKSTGQEVKIHFKYKNTSNNFDYDGMVANYEIRMIEIL